MFEQKNPVNLFPKALWLFELEPGEYNEQLRAEIDRQLTPRPALAHGRTWQTAQTLHQLPVFEALSAGFLKACDTVLEHMAVIHRGFEITGCWANVAPPGSLHTPHVHPNNYLSGVYYVVAPDGADEIAFHDDAITGIRPNTRQLNAFNSPEAVLKIKPGTLVIFSSTLMHSVPVNRASSERMSISFNGVFSDFAQSIAPPRWQGIDLDNAK